MSLDLSKVAAETAAATADFVLPEEGARPARLMQLIDVGIQVRDPFPGSPPKKPCQQVILGFDLVDDLAEFGGEQKPIRVTSGYFPLNVTIDRSTGLPHEKSKLYTILKACDPKNVHKGNLLAMIGSPLLVNVVHAPSKKNPDIVYANYDGCSATPNIKGFEVSESPNDPFIFDFDDPTIESWAALRENVRDICRQAVNYPGSKVEAIDLLMANEEAKGDTAEF